MTPAPIYTTFETKAKHVPVSETSRLSDVRACNERTQAREA